MKKLIVSLFTCGVLLIGGNLFLNDDSQTASAYQPKPSTAYETS
ncbi:hypothetical protein [Virgibacillus sp.]|nr:hypothetical protein [Virgibacillus sp.]